MSNKNIRTPRESKNEKNVKGERKLNKKAVVALICIAAVIVLAAGSIITVDLLNRFAPTVTDMHSPMNALPQNINASVLFKDGGIYLCPKDEQILIDPNVYDPETDGSLDEVTYFWDCSDGTLIYLSDPTGEKKLMQYKDGKSTFLLKNVDSFSISPDRAKIAVVTGANSNGLNGTLLLWENGKTSLLETGGVKSNTLYFSDDSSTLFAQTSSTTKGELHMYRDGEETLLEKDIFALGWISRDGNSYLKVDASDTAYIYDYTLRTVSGKKAVFNNVAYSEASPDGSVMYVMHDYDPSTMFCTLSVIDTVTLRTLQIATDVYSLSPTSVTDTALGMLYATATSNESRFDLYYFDTLKGKSINLAKSVYSASLNNVIIDSSAGSGYMLLTSSNTGNYQLFSLDLSSGSTKAEQILVKDGKTNVTSICELLYYEACNSLVLSANPDKTSLELYMVSGQSSSKLINNCGALYDSSSGAYYSCSMLTNDGQYVVYLKNVVVISETDDDVFADHGNADIYGTLVLYNIQSSEFSVISTNVLADTFDCIQVSGNGKDIYFCTLVDGGKFDAYHYDVASGETTLLMSDIDAMASYN